jgi:hypothetical protein
MKLARPLALCALAAVAACDTQSARSTPGVAGQFAATAEAAAAPATLAETGEYRLTMDLVRRAVEAERNLAVVTYRDPGLAAPHGTEPMAEQVAMLEASPVLLDAVKRAGITPREKVVARWVLQQATIAQGVIDGGAAPETVLGSIRIHPDNVAFFRQHRAEIARLQKAAEDEINEGEVIPGLPSAEIGAEN